MSAMNDGAISHGRLSDSHGLHVETTPRDRRFRRHLTSLVSQVLQNSMDTHPDAHCGEPVTAPFVPGRRTNIQTLADDEFACAADPVFLCGNDLADEIHLAKADGRIAHALKKVMPPLYQPGRGGSIAHARTNESEHAAPKYKNIDSLLRYVEADSGQGAVKVVIMNFND